jgi:predicted anti-sigma-YlaC factor YlaD
MMKPDHSTYREWLNLDVDGALPREHRALLDEHLASCAECRTEREGLLAFEGFLRDNRVAVQPDFRERVLSALPTAGWESRSPRTWAFPAAAFVLLAGIAVLVTGGRGSHSSLLSALAAVAGLFRASAVAGAGLISASWKGLGMAFGALLASPLSLGVFGVFVLCLNLILFSLLRRRRSVPADVLRREMDRPGRTR